MNSREQKSTVTPDAREAFSVALEGMAVYGEEIAGAIFSVLEKNPGACVEDLVVCVDAVGSQNHRTALAASLADPAVPFVHTRLRARSGCIDVRAARPPAGFIWLQVCLPAPVASRDAAVYELALVKPIMVDGIVWGVVLTAAGFDKGAEYMAARAS